VRKRRNAAWFAGYAPADHPLYAFAVVVEGNPGESLSGGSNAAPVIGSVLAKLLKDYKGPPKEEEVAEEAGDEETPVEMDEESGYSLDAPVELTEFTEDLMNPEGAPMPEEVATE